MSNRVLIVDDHETFRATARLLLESEGYQVVGEAETGEAVAEQVAVLAPDLILLDVQLPGIDGFEVARRVTAEAGSPAVIMVSSRDGGEYGPMIAACGARGFVSKADLSGERLRALLET